MPQCKKTCLGFPKRSYQTSLLRNFSSSQFRYDTFQYENNKGPDQIAQSADWSNFVCC